MSGANTVWYTGAASIPFPVQTGTPLAGYVARTGVATGTLDELSIGAFVLENEDRRLVIVAADIVAVDAALAAEVAAVAGLEREELALCASHTHSGPAGVVARLHPADEDRLDHDLQARFVATAVEAIATARASIERADPVAGVAMTEGAAANRNDTRGPHDPRLTVLATRRGDGTFQCVLCHFACHPTILGGENRLVSADFPGALRRNLDLVLRGTGTSPVLLFVNGAAGDVSTRFTRHAQDAGEVARVGGILTSAAILALDNAAPLPGPIRYGRTTVPLSRRARRPCVRPVSPSRTGRVAEPFDHRPSGQQRVAETRVQGAAMLKALGQVPDEAIPSELLLEAWALGAVVLVAVPGELFASLGGRIAAGSAGPTVILGYANGYVGYLADVDAHESQTYEALASPFGPEAGNDVAIAAAALVERMRSGDSNRA